MDLLLGKLPLLAFLSITNKKKWKKKQTANCFEVNVCVKLPASKCKNFALLVMRHDCLSCEEQWLILSKIPIMSLFLQFSLVCKFYILWICLKQNCRFWFLLYSKSLFDANSLCSNALIYQVLSNITLQHCWLIMPEMLWFDVLSFACSFYLYRCKNVHLTYFAVGK